METYKIVLVVLFVALSGFFQGQMEKISFNFYESLFVNCPIFFNPKVSFLRKYKQLPDKYIFTDQDGRNHNVHKVDKAKSRFAGSKSVFVWLTDGWHLFKFISGTFFCIAITILAMVIFQLTIIESIAAFAAIKIIETTSGAISYKLK